jgi:hypothetical protein
MIDNPKDEVDILSILASMEDDDDDDEVMALPDASEATDNERFPPYEQEKFSIPGEAADRSCAEDRAIMENRLRNNEKDIFCGSCGQKLGVYYRGFTWSYSATLARIVYLYEKNERWYHADEFNKTGGGDYAKLLAYGVIERRPNDDPDKSSSGDFRPTEFGIDVAHRRHQIPSGAWWFHKVCRGFNTTMFWIDECTGKFSFQDLWNDAEKPPTKKKKKK